MQILIGSPEKKHSSRVAALALRRPWPLCHGPAAKSLYSDRIGSALPSVETADEVISCGSIAAESAGKHMDAKAAWGRVDTLDDPYLTDTTGVRSVTPGDAEGRDPFAMPAGPGELRESSRKRRKTSTTIRLDQDVLEWLRGPGPGYQSRINAILRREMLRARKL